MSKTALELTHHEWQAYQPAKHTETDKTALAARRQQALKLARQAAQLLKERFGAQRVMLFGSLRDETLFTWWSDIDLAAWGISEQQIYKAIAQVAGLSPDFKIDLVDLDVCRPGLKTVIERDGVEL